MKLTNISALFVCFILLGGPVILIDPQTGEQTQGYDYGGGVIQGQDGSFHQYNSPIEPTENFRATNPYTYHPPQTYDPDEMRRERNREEYWRMIEEIKRRKF